MWCAQVLLPSPGASDILLSCSEINPLQYCFPLFFNTSKTPLSLLVWKGTVIARSWLGVNGERGE